MGAALLGSGRGNTAEDVVGYQQAIGSIAVLAFAGTLVALIPAYAKAPEEKNTLGTMM